MGTGIQLKPPVHYPLILTTTHLQYRSLTECHKLISCLLFMTQHLHHTMV